jgi:hypothetical protein
VPLIDVLFRRLITFIMVLACGFLTAACADYTARRDTVTAQSGDAVAANRALHTLDPWPRASANTDIPVSGAKIVDAIERLNAPRPLDAAPSTTPLTTQ